jgi:plasmid maintenance system killer protein
MKVEKIFIDRESLSYLKSRWLISQFRKAKFFILNWLYKNAGFKIREPKKKWKYYFRINKQYRAIWKFKWNDFHIMEVYDHKR